MLQKAEIPETEEILHTIEFSGMSHIFRPRFRSFRPGSLELPCGPCISMHRGSFQAPKRPEAGAGWEDVLS